jgi:phosphoserine phosphatase RsbU/P
MYFLLIIALIFAIVFFSLYILARKDNTRLDEEKQLIQQEKQLVLDFMHDLVEALGEGLSREDLFQRIVHAAILSTGALSACVFERNGESALKGVAVEGLFPPQNPLPPSSQGKLTTRAKFIEQILKSETIQYGQGLIGMVAQSGEAVLIQDGSTDPRICRHDDPALAIKSIIAAPIVFRNRLIAVLAVANPADGMAFNETDFSLVQSLADQAGLAIHNADLLNLQIEKKKLDLDLSLASNIQQMLLPKDYPVVRDLEMDAVYIPAQKVGGDLYDFFPLSETRLGLAIADVSGKGIPASLMMTICRCNLRHFSSIYDSPSRVLSELNRSMSPDMRQDMFITLIFAIVDTEKHEVVFARAGHELPLLAYHNPDTGIHHTEMLGSEGIAVGLVDSELFDQVIEDKRVPFERGNVLVFYTDGVTEAANDEGIEFSGGRLADAVKTLRNRTCHELNQGIIGSVERFAGRSGISDDISLVTVKHL